MINSNIQEENNIQEEKLHQEKSYILSKVLCSVFILIAFLLFYAALWYVETYGDTGFDSILFTLFSNLDGVEADIVESFVLRVINPAIITCELAALILFFDFKKLKFRRIKHICSMVVSVVLIVVLVVNAGIKVDLFDYLYAVTHQSEIFTTSYVDPVTAEISFPEKKRNLIYIFLESIETTFLNEEKGGALKNDVMPELTALAEENINFSHNNGVGGFLTPTGTTWTASGMVAQTAGIPLKEAPGLFERNEYGKDSFLPGAMAISNIFKENGYNQALMVGSFASFAHRDVYYKSHDTDIIYDLSTARNEGLVPKDYYVWWGMEDKYLFDFAKEKINELASKEDEPFAFSMLTMDTHFTAGYVCELCSNDFEEQYDNVISCSSRQVGAFIEWIKQQSFYENTTIVIAGDHLTMDNGYIERNVAEGYDRRVYNCIINSAVNADNYKNREFSGFDLFPTTLAAMGCEIEGERLALGTNLFSDVPTLIEEMGYEEFDKEVSLNSSFYIKNFVVE